MEEGGDSVHVDPILEQRRESMDVGVESRKADHQLIMHRENFLGVSRQSLCLNSEPPVRSNSNAILSSHCHKGGAIVGHDGHGCRAKMAWASNNNTTLSM
jgi:hypothetical protein